MKGLKAVDIDDNLGEGLPIFLMKLYPTSVPGTDGCPAWKLMVSEALLPSGEHDSRSGQIKGSSLSSQLKKLRARSIP
jgi:hypothetical protein